MVMKPENSPLYDLTSLQEQTGNDDDFLHQMVLLFIQQTAENLIKINRAIQQKDWTDIHFAVHKMKSAINLFCIKSLQQIIVETEELSLQKTNEKKLIENLKLIEQVLNECMLQLKSAFHIE